MGPLTQAELVAELRSDLQDNLKPPAFLPQLGTTPGGALAATTYYVRITFAGLVSGETSSSVTASVAVPVNNLPVVTSPAQGVDGAAGWNVYMGSALGSEKKQNATPIAFGTNFTLPVTGLVDLGSVPMRNDAIGPKHAFSDGQLVAFVRDAAGWYSTFHRRRLLLKLTLVAGRGVYLLPLDFMGADEESFRKAIGAERARVDPHRELAGGSFTGDYGVTAAEAVERSAGERYYLFAPTPSATYEILRYENVWVLTISPAPTEGKTLSFFYYGSHRFGDSLPAVTAFELQGTPSVGQTLTLTIATAYPAYTLTAADFAAEDAARSLASHLNDNSSFAASYYAAAASGLVILIARTAGFAGNAATWSLAVGGAGISAAPTSGRFSGGDGSRISIPWEQLDTVTLYAQAQALYMLSANRARIPNLRLQGDTVDLESAAGSLRKLADTFRRQAEGRMHRPYFTTG